MDKITRQAAHFDGIAETYRVARQHRNHRTIRHLMWNEFLGHRDTLRRPGCSVLEPMCGFAAGREVLSTYLGVPFRYRGFDYSTAVIDSLKASNPDLVVNHADVTRFEADSEYDIIILIGGLHHVPDHANQVVPRLGRALKPGGYFINFEPTNGNPLFTSAREWIYRRNSLFDAETERGFSIRAYYDMFERAGLRHVDSTYPGLLAYVLYYNPDAFPMLNVGGPWLVRALWWLERPFRRSAIGRMLSFATLALWQRPEFP